MDGTSVLQTRGRVEIDSDYELNDRYARREGAVFLTGTQALVRIALDQRRIDKRDGLNTAGFVSGYRGSPLGGYDQALWKAKAFLEEEGITFKPAINEDLAGTALMGTQQVESDNRRTVDGVFGIWYGKGPGVDRSGDALKHGTAYGSSPHGGVLVVAGDDHGCVSSSMSHQSEQAMISWYMPVIHPANVAEYRDFGLWGFAASRFSGAWIGFKAISETVESAQSVELGPLPRFATPPDYDPPEDGLHYRWPDLPGMQVEHRQREKMKAIRAFARANPLDRLVLGDDRARFGIVTVGKAHLDLMDVLGALGIDDAKAKRLGLAVYKVGLVWPVEDRGLAAFARGKDEILVVEEKRPVVEDQIKTLLYTLPDEERPRVTGKTGAADEALIPDIDETRPSRIVRAVAARLGANGIAVDSERAVERLTRDISGIAVPESTSRTPYFCSGCPHNTSTKLPEGSEAFGGIGCHFMASWMDRDTSVIIQMGGEGVHWMGKAPFIGHAHAFQNLGDGTYFHSGLMAIRQAIAAGVNLTYKILFNDAVAMTGGQPVDGELTVPEIAHQVRAEGVERIAVMSDEPDKYGTGDFPEGTAIHHRDHILTVQQELRETPGVTVLIYDQTCAAEKRRRRKRGTFPNPPKRVFINEDVCEGCGDCSVQSNCLSVVPVETELGRKRKIDQSSCNKDYSCLEGFCPSFVTVEGEGMELRKSAGASVPEDRIAARIKALPEPEPAIDSDIANILVTGVGGTGVVTLGQIITMAAHLEGKGASVLDFMGFAQKFGPVLSHIRVAEDRKKLNQVRIDQGSADALIACDIVVATQPEPLAAIDKDHTRVVVNRAVIPTADYVHDLKADLDYRGRLRALESAAGKRTITEVAANRIAERVMGDTVFANMFLAGFAWQQGLVPLSLGAMMRAIELNGVAVEANQRAFQLGRLAADDPKFIEELAGDGEQEMTPAPKSLDELIDHRAGLLVDYQNAAYAEDYRRTVERVRAAERATAPASEALTRAVAENLYKLMAYKDEYEVARLYTEGPFKERLRETFAGDYKLKFHLAPPLLARKKDELGRPKKMTFSGRWLFPALKGLAKLRFLRGTLFDPFARHPDRRLERRLLAEYRETIQTLLSGLTREKLGLAAEIAALPDEIRGYGPVKSANARKAKARETELLTKYRAPHEHAVAAE